MSLFSHHAYALYGNVADTLQALQSHLEREGIVLLGNPDAIVVHTDTLSIDAVREIQARTHTAPETGAQRVVIIAAVAVTNEAQNALLKESEEPGARTTFFFIVPSPAALLPTLRSRLEPLPLKTAGEHSRTTGTEFLHASFPRRLEMLSPLIEERQYGEILSLLYAIESLVYAQGVEPHKEFLKRMEMIRGHVLSRGASVKQLLEYCALSAPRFV